MLYMPATTPVVLQETQMVPLPSQSRYFMLQPTSIIPAVPVLNTTYVYPRYGFVPKPVETSVKKDELEQSQQQPTQLFDVTPPVQHVIHHHIRASSSTTCPGYCELCCPWITEPPYHKFRSRSPSPERHERRSRRDDFERDELDRHHHHSSKDKYERESIDEKIERIRRELGQHSSQRHDKSTETLSHYRPPSPPLIQHHIHHEHKVDPPRSRSGSRPRSASSHRASSLPREPWRSSNQNDYQWRDAHLPAYREATLARSQTPTDQSRTWHENAHQRSHRNTQSRSPTTSNSNYIYRPKSESESRKWYTQSTGKDPDREVYQALRGGTTTYTYTGPSSSSSYSTSGHEKQNHSFYSDIPTNTKSHTLKKIDSTHHHDLYGCNEPCLHIVPKQGGSFDPPYLKIINAPVTYLH